MKKRFKGGKFDVTPDLLKEVKFTNLEAIVMEMICQGTVTEFVEKACREKILEFVYHKIECGTSNLEQALEALKLGRFIFPKRQWRMKVWVAHKRFYYSPMMLHSESAWRGNACRSKGPHEFIPRATLRQLEGNR